MTREPVAVQPFASVTVTKCDPALRPVAVAVVWAFVQLYVYGGVPPAALADICPSDAPLQLTPYVPYVTAKAGETDNTGVFDMVTVAFALQP